MEFFNTYIQPHLINLLLTGFWYYNYALGTSAIQSLVNSGPNTKMIGGNGLSDKIYNYLSLRWFFYGTENDYNRIN